MYFECMHTYMHEYCSILGTISPRTDTGSGENRKWSMV